MLWPADTKSDEGGEKKKEKPTPKFLPRLAPKGKQNSSLHSQSTARETQYDSRGTKSKKYPKKALFPKRIPRPRTTTTKKEEVAEQIGDDEDLGKEGKGGGIYT